MDHSGGVPDPKGVGVLESDFPVPGGASLQGGRDKVVGWMGAVQTCMWQTRTDSIDRTPVLSRHTWSVFLSLFRLSLSPSASSPVVPASASSKHLVSFLFHLPRRTCLLVG